MADMMNVRLSSQAAAAHWGEGALLSFNGDEAHLHLGRGGQEKEALRAIQRGARRLESSGIKRVKLVGEGWDRERRSPSPRAFTLPRACASSTLVSSQRRRLVSWKPCSRRLAGCAR